MYARNAFLLVLAAGVAGGVVAQTPDLSWHTIDGGGHMSSAAGQFTLAGTIGQPDAGLVMSGGGFQLRGGFWAFGGDVPSAPGDCDADNDVDLIDYGTIADCLGGPAATAETATCSCFDLDGSGNVDLRDFAEFQVVFEKQ